MPNTPDFIAYALELMRPVGRVSARAMFGGHGLYVDGLIVAIVVDDVVYLKTDDESRPAFLALGLPPFLYTTKEGEVHAMSYYRAPDEAMENPSAMAEWLRPAVGVALRAAKGNKRGKVESSRGRPRSRGPRAR